MGESAAALPAAAADAPVRTRRVALHPLLAGAEWRVRILGSLLLVALLLPVLGVPVPPNAIAVLAAWFAVGALTQPMLRALRRSGRESLVMPAAALVFGVDCTAQLLIYLDLGGGAWMAGAFFLFASFAANSTLPRRFAYPVTAYAAALCVAVSLAEARGMVRAAPAFGESPLVGNYRLAIFTAVFSAVLVVAAAAVQQTLVAAMRRTGARHRLVLEAATDMIFTLDRRMRFATINDAVTRDSGFAQDTLVGQPFEPLLVPDDAPRAMAHLQRALGGVEQRFETRFRTRDGSVRWIAVTASPVREREVVASVLAIARDVTDARDADEQRERMQAQLAQSQKMEAVGQLVSGVAHELNNPLTAVLAFTEELLAEPRMSSDEQALRTIYLQVQRARAIVRDLRAFVRQGDGESERASTAEAVERVVWAAGKAARDAGASLDLQVYPDAPDADVPRSALEQVVTNLVLNAVYAAGAAGGRPVHVVVRGGDGVSEIVVEDEGAGIPDAVLPHVFEPFFTTKPTGQGTGLGLSVSLGIAQQYGGTIEAGRRDDGGGARFVVRLPALGVPVAPRGTSGADATAATPTSGSPAEVATGLADSPAPTSERATEAVAAPAAAAPSASPAAPPRVLVVDDEDSIRLALRRFFSRRGWQVDDASNGAEALTHLVSAERGAYDVILCDLKMPGLSGPEFYHELERSAAHWLDRLILSTGDVASPEAATFLSHARCPVLEKPFELSALAAAVEAVRERNAGNGGDRAAGV